MTRAEANRLKAQLLVTGVRAGLPKNCEGCHYRRLGRLECKVLIALRDNCFVIAQEKRNLERGIFPK